MKKTTLSSRQFAASVTGLTDRYRHNPYVRSTVNIVLLQALLTIILVIAFGVALHYAQQGTITAISRSIATAVETGATSTPSLDQALEDTRNETLQYTLLGLVLITIFFAYLAARFALRPTKNSLEFQKRFIGNMAHEVRTPLSIIKTNTEVALLDPNLPTDAQETFTITLQELDRISETINNLLSFDTLVRPNRLSFAPVDLNALVEAVEGRHAALARSRGIDLSYHAEGQYTVFGNAAGIDQVLTNLIKNAINYTPRNGGGAVTVLLTGDESEVHISVADTGIGIARKDLYYVFQPFYRADTSRTGGVGASSSSGLGLAIVNEIVRLHDGKIFVRSALNRGTTIEVILPKFRKKDGETSDSQRGLAEGVEADLEVS